MVIALLARISKCLSDCNVHIAFMKLFWEEKGAQAYFIAESDERLPLEITEKLAEELLLMYPDSL